MIRTDLATRLRRAIVGPGRPSSDFDLNPDVALPEGRKLRPAAVLIAVREVAGGRPEMILTKRSTALKHHPGQIAFPGGKLEPCDIDAGAGALREAEEEIGLPASAVELLGALPVHETVTGFSVTPIVGLVHSPFEVRPEAGEVSEVFTAPFDHVTDPARFIIEHRFWRGHQRRYFAVPYGPYYIWGATARMLRGLADRMTP